jgi:hypothetical protein
VNLAGEVHVAVETAATAEEADVLEPLDGLSDAELAHQETAGTGAGMVGGAYHKFNLRHPRVPLLEWRVLRRLRS